MSLFSSFSSVVVPEKDVNTTVDTALDTTFDSTVASADGATEIEKDASGQVKVSFSAPPQVQKRDDSPFRGTIRLEPQEVQDALAEPEADPAMEISTKEADYDKGPTELYRLIEKRKWEEAEKLLNRLAKFAATEQASTWVVRREKSGKLRWRLLPLHAAIIFRGPLSIVESLVRAYPGGARCKDDQGMLPLHLAFRNDAPDVIIDEVLTAYPEAVAVQDRKGRVPLTCAMGPNCTKKTRAKLLATYSGIAVASEKEQFARANAEATQAEVKAVEGSLAAEIEAHQAELKVAEEKHFAEIEVYKAELKVAEDKHAAKIEARQAELYVAEDRHAAEIEANLAELKVAEDRHAAEIVELKKTFEENLVETLNIKKENEDSLRREQVLMSELSESKLREDELAQKVSDLSKALEAMTTMRKAETERFNEESSQWSRVSQDLIQKMTAVQTERDSVAEEVDRVREENEKATVQKDVLRQSIDDLVLSHRSLQAERDELILRKEELTSLMERNLAEQDGIHAIFQKLDQDMSAAATVRERMISAIAKQESDVYSLAAREHDVMRGILQRQKEEMEECLRMNGDEDGLIMNSQPGEGGQLRGHAQAQTEMHIGRGSRSRSASPMLDRVHEHDTSRSTPVVTNPSMRGGRRSPSYGAHDIHRSY